MSAEKNVKVLLFGAAADRVGKREIEVPIKPGATLEEVFSEAADKHPGLSPMRDMLAFAINGEYAGKKEKVSPGDEVAFLPPVSGG